MKRIEFRERQQIVIGIDLSRPAVHRIEQLPQLGLALGNDWCEHQEVRLRSHRCLTQTPHPLWARNEGRRSCYGVAVITRNTCDAGRGFGYPVVGARRWYAMGCMKASWQIPFGPANRIS